MVAIGYTYKLDVEQRQNFNRGRGNEIKGERHRDREGERVPEHFTNCRNPSLELSDLTKV